MSQNNHNRIHSIDFIRGVSIHSVILLHINLVMPLASSSLGALLPPVLSKILLWSGYYGVITFFVVSGFLITTSAISRWGNLNQVKADQFYLIRFARIMPCLFALLIILTFLDRLGVKGFIINPDNTTLPRAIFAVLTFNINWLEAQTGYLPAAWDVLWSLSIEEMFYLFFPVICRFTKGSWSFILLMLGFILLGPFARTLFTSNEIWMDHSYLSCMDGIAMGCLAALFASRYRMTKTSTHYFMVIGSILSLFILVFRKQVFELGLTEIGLNVTLLELGIALIVIACYGKSLHQPWGDDILTAPVRWFGRNSYEIYLTHCILIIPCVFIIQSLGVSKNFIPIWFFVLIMFSGLSGAIVARYFSEPMNRLLRNKMEKKQQRFEYIG